MEVLVRQTDAQTEGEIEPSPDSLAKVECTHCKNYMNM